jgi:hypothetical protein
MRYLSPEVDENGLAEGSKIERGGDEDVGPGARSIHPSPGIRTARDPVRRREHSGALLLRARQSELNATGSIVTVEVDETRSESH